MRAIPARTTKLEDLGPALKKLVGDDPTNTITLLAPLAMPAREARAVHRSGRADRAALSRAPTRTSRPKAGSSSARSPSQLTIDGKPEIAVTGEMTVQNLATELGKRAGQHVSRVGVVAPR